MKNPWDSLSSTFNTKKEDGEVSPEAADNILIAWPVVLDSIEKYKPEGEHLRALEYGCGGGEFAGKLASLGYEVTGVDSSDGMIRVASTSQGSKATFRVGDSSILHALPKFQIITSIMTLQFIDNIEKTLSDFSNALLPGGIVIFAVHNPDFVQDCLQANILFEGLDADKQSKKGFLNLGGNKIPIFIRTAEEYTQILQSKGFELLFEAEPLFTQEFLTKYPVVWPTDHSEYVILGYRKQ